MAEAIDCFRAFVERTSLPVVSTLKGFGITELSTKSWNARNAWIKCSEPCGADL